MNTSLEEVLGNEDVVLRFSVKDTGIGIPPEVQLRLFDKFMQADPTTSRVYGGTGLGLAISKQLVGLMGGKVGLNSELGKGSEFWFTAQFGKQDPAAFLASHAGVLDGSRVLVVDDEAESSEVICELLTEWGMEPIALSDGPSALGALYKDIGSSNPIRCAIIDKNMPDMDGFALAKAIKGEGRFANIRLLLLTGEENMELIGPMRESGFEAFCAKPYRASELFNSLVHLFGAYVGNHDNVSKNRLRRFETNKPRILLVEDNVVNQLVAKGILAQLGLNADVAANGLEAIHAVKTLPYDLVFMDVQMPQLDGPEATREIRKWEALEGRARMPIVALTAHARVESKLDCLDAGMDDHVSKPVEANKLIAVLDDWIPNDFAEREAITVGGGAPSLVEPRVSTEELFSPEGLMKRMMDDEELFRAVLEASISDVKELVGKFSNAVAENRKKDAALSIHSIKGSARNASFTRLAVVAKEIEEGIKSEREEDVELLLGSLDELVVRTLKEAERALG